MRWACDVLRLVDDATNGVDGRVSIEVDARLAHYTEATIAEARALWRLVDRPNLFIKIPAARQGLPAIAGCLAEGISINVTLIFSLQRYDAVMEAFLDGMERARQAGDYPSSMGSVASFLLSRVDNPDRRPAGQDRDQRGSRTARAGRDRERPPRLPALRAGVLLTAVDRAERGRGPAAAAVVGLDVGQGPAYPDTRYVVDLVAPGVVNTMPEATLRLVAEHGQAPADSVHGQYDESQQVLDQLQRLGIDYDDVTQKLEDNGVATFDTAWQRLAAAGRHPAHPIGTAARELTMDTTHLIVGASLAGVKAAETLRGEGFDGPLVMVGAERERPYERPPLSKDDPLGKAERETDSRSAASGTPSTRLTCASVSPSPASIPARTR